MHECLLEGEEDAHLLYWFPFLVRRGLVLRSHLLRWVNRRRRSRPLDSESILPQIWEDLEEEKPKPDALASISTHPLWLTKQRKASSNHKWPHRGSHGGRSVYLTDGWLTPYDNLRALSWDQSRKRGRRRPTCLPRASVIVESRDMLLDFLKEFKDVFTWTYAQMPGLDPKSVTHKLNVRGGARPIKEALRNFLPELEVLKQEIYKEECWFHKTYLTPGLAHQYSSC